MAALLIAIVGAESTGKSALAQALTPRLADSTGMTTTWVPEVLRAWCEHAGRTPNPEEQPAIAAEQQRAIETAASSHDIVLCDTTPLMTAIYSQLLFDDRSLLPAALDFQRRIDLTLLTALDLPWQADGLQRDGPHVQAPVDAALRAALSEAGLGWARVHGEGAQRSEAALDAIAPLLRGRARRDGLFTRLQARQQGLGGQDWVCRDCDVPECEHLSLQLLAPLRHGKD